MGKRMERVTEGRAATVGEAGIVTCGPLGRVLGL